LTRLLLLGTAGGPTYWPNTDRHSTSSALVVGDAVYLVDCGDGVGKRLQEALDPPDQRATMKLLRAIFLTHLHSDHVIDYPNILLYGWFAGIESAASPLRVFGPGRRGEMEPVFTPPGRKAVEPPVINPSNPTPGTADMTEYLYQAFATDINDRMRDVGRKTSAHWSKSKTSSCLKLPGSSHRMRRLNPRGARKAVPIRK
jgi:ribonuclease BN (tRNA processing enzyme)